MTSQAGSGPFTNLDGPLAALRTITDKLIASDPLIPDTWEVDFQPVTMIAKAHLILWSPDGSARADRRLRHKGSVWHSTKNTAIYVGDSALETYLIRHMRVEMHGWNRAKHSMANACAETFLSRTSRPYYHGEKSAYPIHAPNDKQISARLKDVWVYFRPSGGSANQSWGELFSQPYRYASPSVRVDLLVKSGLMSRDDAQAVMKKIYPRGGLFPVLSQRGAPHIAGGFGAELHGLPHPADKIHLAAVAGIATFSGLFTWERFNGVLVEGGWPWLRQYPRAYARTIYTAMVLIFAAIECSDGMQDLDKMRDRLIALAGKLVGDPAGGPGRKWRVRKSAYLQKEKVLVPASGNLDNAQQQQQQQQPPQGAPTQNLPAESLQKHSSSSAPNTSGSSWHYLEKPPTAMLEGRLPSHIAVGAPCEHQSAPQLSARVTLAHSVAELAAATDDGKSLTVALTPDQAARNEALDFVVQNSIMAVRRVEGQCLSCAVKLAHCVGALAVIS